MSGDVSIIRDRLVLLGWIAGLLAAIALLWALTRPVQARYLMQTANRALAAAGDTRRLGAETARPAGKSGLLGYWYSMYNATERMFIFGAIQDGILVPCGAVVSDTGEVMEIIPLSAHARQVLEHMPPSVMRIYVRRIESALRPGSSSSFLTPRGTRR
jgi:hypothetical protein